jgi:hypothetical protein
MNQQRNTKLTRLFSHLKHVMHADPGPQVRRRNLLSSRQGDIQLELDFGDPRSAFSRQKWIDLSGIEPPVLP